MPTPKPEDDRNNARRVIAYFSPGGPGAGSPNLVPKQSQYANSEEEYLTRMWLANLARDGRSVGPLTKAALENPGGFTMVPTGPNEWKLHPRTPNAAQRPAPVAGQQKALMQTDQPFAPLNTGPAAPHPHLGLPGMQVGGRP